jgi:hypothetical protein
VMVALGESGDRRVERRRREQVIGSRHPASMARASGRPSSPGAGHDRAPDRQQRLERQLAVEARVLAERVHQVWPFIRFSARASSYVRSSPPIPAAIRSYLRKQNGRALERLKEQLEAR